LISQELLTRLQELSRADKLHVMQLLASDLADESHYIAPGSSYEIFSPYGNEAAAQVLYDVLQAAENTDQRG